MINFKQEMSLNMGREVETELATKLASNYFSSKENKSKTIHVTSHGGQ
jgi:hypothetical protein